MNLRSRFERSDLALQDIRDRAFEHPGRLEGLRQLSKGSVELDDLGVQVIEPSGHELACSASDVLIDLATREPHILCERDKILDRPIVKVEPARRAPRGAVASA